MFSKCQYCANKVVAFIMQRHSHPHLSFQEKIHFMMKKLLFDSVETLWS